MTHQKDTHMVHADQYERQMLDLINAERAAVGAAPLVLEMNLNLAAEDHSDWMLRTDIFSHTGAWGSQHSERMADAGFDLVPSWGTAENIAVQSIRGAAGIADDVIDLHIELMDSSGHRANILNADMTHIGIGIEVGGYKFSSGEYTSVMVTQVFGYTQGSIDTDTTALPPTPPNDGNEVIRGTLEGDSLSGGVGKDRIVAFKGDDYIDGGTQDDRLFGNGGDDVILARRGDDKLFGGSGHDTIDGGTGNDVLFGDNGADVFVYRPTYQIDRIKDFDVDRDTIDLSAFNFDDTVEALSYAKQHSTNVVFNFGLDDKLILTGVTIADISDDLRLL